MKSHSKTSIDVIMDDAEYSQTQYDYVHQL
jgi:hypothetical protein